MKSHEGRPERKIANGETLERMRTKKTGPHTLPLRAVHAGVTGSHTQQLVYKYSLLLDIHLQMNIHVFI